MMCVQLTDQPDAVVVTVLGIYIDSCIWSIGQSDSRTVTEVRDTFNIHYRITSIYTVEITRLLETVVIAGTGLLFFFSVVNWLQLDMVSLPSVRLVGKSDFGTS